MRQEPYYYQKPVFTISGLTLKLDAWTFSCGTPSPHKNGLIAVDLPAGNIEFTQDLNYDKFATLYIIPTKTKSPEFPEGSNYYLTMWTPDPSLAQRSNPPTETFWAKDIRVIPCLNITIPKVGGGNAIIVEANEFEFPLPVPPPPPLAPPPPEPPPDQRREIQTKIGPVKAWRKSQLPEGWEPLDAKKHKKIFPISLGRLKRGENWYVLTPEAEEKLKNGEKISNF